MVAARFRIQKMQGVRVNINATYFFEKRSFQMEIF